MLPACRSKLLDNAGNTQNVFTDLTAPPVSVTSSILYGHQTTSVVIFFTSEGSAMTKLACD
jgi:hypothetical protein